MLMMPCIGLVLMACTHPIAAKPPSSNGHATGSLQSDGQLMVDGARTFPIAIRVSIPPQWIRTDPVILDDVLHDISESRFNVLINSSGTVGTADEVAQYHEKIATLGLCEIVGLQNYYSTDAVSNRVPEDGSLFGQLSDEQAVRQVIREIGRHPTVAGWFVFDCVPENPTLVNEHYQWIKSEDAKRPVFLECFVATYQQDHYITACDVLINEVYPFDKVLAQAAGFEIRQPAKYRKDGQHVWAAIQGNSWYAYSIHDEVRNLVTPANAPTIQTERTRIPTKDQLIALVLLAWNQNHSGAVFSHPQSILTSAEAERRWPAIRDAAEELGKLSSILVSPAVESGVTSDTSTVSCKLVQSSDSRYLIAVNAGDSPVSTSLSLSAPGHSADLIAGSGAASLSGQQVRVQLNTWQYVVVKLD
jgi:hypothetical protein